MSGLFDDATHAIPCTHCGKDTEKPVAWLRTHDEFRCAFCGGRNQFELPRFRDGLLDIDHEVPEADRAFDALDKLG